ncbi:hypothetical protein HNR42_001459 [Deinobacterium chartae]|uniref:DinB-like domain-containing protein n=1 Tax=Deinobacterium chartae TaxID=521158 RepID=A0A841HYT2_9DEIO|nr:DinB family protein [Deinobacterium chartae]MBB6098036.1 hypothetical protein [Deinobacterium chartae]
MTNPQIMDGWMHVLRETFEGGQPGQGTAFLDRTQSDGSGNHGLFATLDALSAPQASDPTALGLSVAAHAAHIAFHLEVLVRWASGDRGPFDWQSSFSPAVVDEAQWAQTRERVRTAYQRARDLAAHLEVLDADTVGGLAAMLAHAAYHLGAIRQTVKLIG